MKFIHLLDPKSIERLVALGLLTQEIVDEARRELGVDLKQEAVLRGHIKALREIERYASKPVTRYSRRELRRLMEAYPGSQPSGGHLEKRGGRWKQRDRARRLG